MDRRAREGHAGLGVADRHADALRPMVEADDACSVASRSATALDAALADARSIRQSSSGTDADPARPQRRPSRRPDRPARPRPRRRVRPRTSSRTRSSDRRRRRCPGHADRPRRADRPRSVPAPMVDARLRRPAAGGPRAAPPTRRPRAAPRPRVTPPRAAPVEPVVGRACRSIGASGVSRVPDQPVEPGEDRLGVGHGVGDDESFARPERLRDPRLQLARGARRPRCRRRPA